MIYFQAYLKFCCKVRGIKKNVFPPEISCVVNIEDIKNDFPQGTTMEDFWPVKGRITPVHSHRISSGNWTQKPATVKTLTCELPAIAANMDNHEKQLQQQQQQQQQQNIKRQFTEIHQSPLDSPLQPPNKLQKLEIVTTFTKLKRKTGNLMRY